MADYEVTYWPSSNGKDQKWVKTHYEDASRFIRDHRKTDVPASFPLLVVARKSDYRIYLYRKGLLDTSYPIALSQAPEGPKLQQGDNRMPEGAYRIIQKSRGPFSGAYSQYFGPAWMRIDYPNPADAARGKKRGTITDKDYERIIQASQAGTEPPKNTALRRRNRYSRLGRGMARIQPAPHLGLYQHTESPTGSLLRERSVKYTHLHFTLNVYVWEK